LRDAERFDGLSDEFAKLLGPGATEPAVALGFLAGRGRDPAMSRRDLAHVLTALWNLSGGKPEVAVEVADIDDAIGRGRRDMRTPLNLQSLAEQGLVVARGGSWALTPQGVDWIVQDRELSDR
jgi:hypothetical protein